MNTKARLWLALLSWMLLIMAVNSIPGSDLPSAGDASADYFIRQLGHVFLHMVLALLAWMVAKESWKGLGRWLFTIAVSVSYSILDECYQGLIPGRNPNWEDVVYNLAGVLLALGWLAYRYKRKSGVKHTVCAVVL